MTVDLQLIARIKERASHFVLAQRGMTGQHLISNLLSDFPTPVDRELIERAISELVQDKEIIRIEYKIPDLGLTYYSFYIPQGSRLVLS